MPKHAQIVPGHSHAIPSKRPEEAAPASDRARPLAPSAILQRAALAPQSLRPSDILRLQQTLGNRAVGALLSQFSPARSLVQAKLTVHAAGDQYEQEADRMAEAVTGMPAVRREELSRAEKPAVMRMPQPSPAAGGAFEASGAFEQQLQAARGRGQPLPPALKADFETKFGADFGGVRVHADAHAGELNRSIAADAFTAGRDVFFRQGVYDPGSRDGRKLIAHELTHVLQQAADGAAVRSIQRKWVVIDGVRTWVPDDDAPATSISTEIDLSDDDAPATSPLPNQADQLTPVAQDPPKFFPLPPLPAQQQLTRPAKYRPSEESKTSVTRINQGPLYPETETPRPKERRPPADPRKVVMEESPRRKEKEPTGIRHREEVPKFSALPDLPTETPWGLPKERLPPGKEVMESPRPKRKEKFSALPDFPTETPLVMEPRPKRRREKVPQKAISGSKTDPVKNRPMPEEKKLRRGAMHIPDTPVSWTMKDQSNKQPAPDTSGYVPHTYRDIYHLKLRLEDAASTAAGEILDEQLPRFQQIIKNRRTESEWMKSDESIEAWLEGGKVKVDEIKIKGDNQQHVRLVLKDKYMRELARLIYRLSEEEAGPPVMSGPQVMNAIKNAYVRSLNKEGWKPIRKEIKLEGGSAVINTMTPVNKYYDQQAFDTRGEGGWASMGRNLPLDAGHGHATNLWHSELTTSEANPKPIFEAFRSGSMGASRVGSETQEEEFSKQKAHEILQAIAIRKLRSEHEKRKQRYLKGEEESWEETAKREEKPLQVDVVSISLQTPAEFKVGSAEFGKEGNERRDVKLQTKALKHWNGQSEKFRGPDGLPDREVTYNIIVFDAAVNSVGFFAGQDTQNKINETAAEAFLKAYKSWIAANPVPKDSPSKEQNQLIAKRIIVDALMNQITKNYRATKGTRDYELPAKIANAAYLMGHIVQFNCKSGKDRTSVMDIESKFMAMQIQNKLEEIEKEIERESAGKGHAQDLFERYHKTSIDFDFYTLDPANQKKYQKLLLESGNFDLQKLNTGAAGYKILSGPKFEGIVQGRVGSIAAQVQGIAGAVTMEQKYKKKDF